MTTRRFAYAVTAAGCALMTILAAPLAAVPPQGPPAPAAAQTPAGPGPAASQTPPAGQGRGRGMAFTEPAPMDFDDHDGYVPLFDGVSLKGWDGNPKFWRVEGGAIVGESTPANPSGNSYIVYRGLEAKDFTLKFEI